MATASFPTYKWWETDDKTKRLYTELLAEKLASPRKSASSLSRKPSNGKDVRARLTSSPKHEAATTSRNPDDETTDKPPLGKEKDDQHGKYTFETITIDTLAKYDYIKSPRKRAAAPVMNFFDSSNQFVDDSAENKDAKEIRDKLLAPAVSADVKDVPNHVIRTPLSNGHYLISQKLSSARSETKALKTEDEKGKSKESGTKKNQEQEKPSRAKLQEIPEYTSSESSESSADDTTLLEKESAKETKKFPTLVVKKKQGVDNKKTCKNDEPLKIEELSTKFQFLCEEVEQLEFKMYEFCDDISRLTQSMGIKPATTNNNTEEAKANGGLTSEKKNDLGLTRQPSFTFADKFNSKALLMKQHSSPSKMLTKPSALLQAKLPPEATGKEAAMAELKKNGALNEIVDKIKEQEFSEDEILEILKCAKAKYIEKPNYLEELGYGRKND